MPNSPRKRSPRSLNQRLKEGTWDDPRNRDETDFANTITQCEALIESIDDAPESIQNKAFDFFNSVREGVTAILKTIQENQHVTERQQNAINNWESGVNRWLHRE